jgi:hypothetical protein
LAYRLDRRIVVAQTTRQFGFIENIANDVNQLVRIFTLMSILPDFVDKLLTTDRRRHSLQVRDDAKAGGKMRNHSATGRAAVALARSGANMPPKNALERGRRAAHEAPKS